MSCDSSRRLLPRILEDEGTCGCGWAVEGTVLAAEELPAVDAWVFIFVCWDGAEIVVLVGSGGFVGVDG